VRELFAVAVRNAASPNIPRGRYLLLWLVSVVGAAIFEAPQLG
jgi:hypothetical protein